MLNRQLITTSLLAFFSVCLPLCLYLAVIMYAGPDIKLCAELGSVPQQREGLYASEKGNALVYFEDTEIGIGAYLLDRETLRSTRIYVEDEKNSYRRYKFLGWSPSGTQVAFVDLNHSTDGGAGKAILLFDLTGKVVADIGAKGLELSSQLVWLSDTSFVYSSPQNKFWALYRASTAGLWDPQTTFRMENEGRMKEVGRTSAHSMAWLSNGKLLSLDVNTGQVTEISRSVAKNIKAYSHRGDSGNFVVTCDEIDNPISIEIRPPRHGETISEKVGQVKTPHAVRSVDLDMRGGKFSFLVTLGAEERVRFVWDGMLRYFAVGGRRLFFSGNKRDQTPGIWSVDLDSGEASCLVPHKLARSDKIALLGPTNLMSGLTDASQGSISYRIWSPEKMRPGKKYPLILGQSLCVWDCFPCIAAHCGYFYAADNLTNWFNPQDSYSTNILSLYAILSQDPRVDTNRVYLIGYSAQSGSIGQLLNIRPDMFKGLILMHPGDLPELLGTKVSRALIVAGAQDRNAIESTEDLLDYQDDAYRKGVALSLFLENDVRHFARSLNSKKDEAVCVAKFLAASD